MNWKMPQPSNLELLKEYYNQRGVSGIPCFRQTFLTGISSGLLATIGYFLFTSNSVKAARIGFVVFPVMTIGTWIYCRSTLNEEQVKNKAFYEMHMAQQKILEKKAAKVAETSKKDVDMDMEIRS